MGRLLEALKKKYKRPQDALRALGLDERLLTGDVVHSRSDDEYFHRGRDINDPLAGMDRHRRRTARDTFGLPSGTAGIAPKRESMPPQRLSSEAEDDLEDFREHLRRHMSEDQVEEACELSRDYMRRRSANGHDRRRVSRDEFPRNAVRSSEREAPSRGHWASSTARGSVCRRLDFERTMAGRRDGRRTPVGPDHRRSRHRSPEDRPSEC